MRAWTLLSLFALFGCAGPQKKAADQQSPAPAAKAVAVDRSGLPTPETTPAWDPPAVSTWTMPNGISVWYLEQKQAPLISLHFILPSGAATDPAGKAGLTSVTADMLNEGAGKLSSLALGEAFQRLATDYSSNASTDVTTFSLGMLADKLEPSLGLLADILRRPTLAAAEFERRKAQHIAGALAAEADPGTARSMVVRRALFGQGSGGWSPSGARFSLETLGLEDVKAHYSALVQPEGATFVVVGAVSKPELEKSLNAHFGDWKGTPTTKAAAVEAQAPTRGIYLVDFPGATQSALSVARRVPGAKAEDYFPALVANWTIGGAFTSRLNLNLREDKGYTYGARSRFSRWREAGMFSLGARVKADTTRASLDEIFKELAGFQGDRPVTVEERNQAIGGLLLGFPGRFERMGGVGRQLSNLVSDGLPVDWYQQWRAKVEASGLEQVNATAKQYSVAADFLVVVAGDRKLVESSLKELGMPIFLYDAQGRPIAEAAGSSATSGPATK